MHVYTNINIDTYYLTQADGVDLKEIIPQCQQEHLHSDLSF